MIAELFELTALPNLHPALVHFPIALAAAAFLFDAVAFFRRPSSAGERSAAALWILAAGGAGATYLAGRAAADSLGGLSAPVEAVLAAHADAGLVTVAGLGTFASLRAWFCWRERRSERAANSALSIALLLAGGVLQAVVAYTADLGGALVFRHGVAVSAPRAVVPPPISTSPGDAYREDAQENGVAHLEDGSLAWTPIAGDAEGFHRVVESIGDVAVRILPATDDTQGVSLLVSGRTLFHLPGAWEDVQLELQLDASEFEGSVALGARIEDETDGGFAFFGSGGGTKLVVRLEGRDEVLDENDAGLPASGSAIGLSAVGRHWKGFSGGKTVVHGHASLPKTGRVALLLDGSGRIRLIALRISRVESPRKAIEPLPEAPRLH